MEISKKSKYYRKLFGGGSILLGAYFVIEHIWNIGEFSFYDFIGHEWLGLLLIVVGILLNINFSKKNLSKELR